jgi:hypothetical protein
MGGEPSKAYLTRYSETAIDHVVFAPESLPVLKGQGISRRPFSPFSPPLREDAQEPGPEAGFSVYDT